MDTAGRLSWATIIRISKARTICSTRKNADFRGNYPLSPCTQGQRVRVRGSFRILHFTLHVLHFSLLSFFPKIRASHMSRTKDQLLKTVIDTGVIAVIRAPAAEVLLPIAEALLAGGIPAVEVTMTTPKAIAGIEMLADRFGDRAVIGVGTVLDAATARDAIAAGAEFVLSPTFEPDVVATTRRYGKISVPGAFTPTEILHAWTAGADIVKLFPSTVLGPGY